MKLLLKLVVGITIGVTVCNAQTINPYKIGTTPYLNGGKLAISIHPAQAVESLDHLILLSELIIDGTVREVLPSIDKSPNNTGEIETDSLVLVHEILRGTLPVGTQSVTLVQVGGKTERWDITVPDDPLVKPGERYILFLTSVTGDDPAKTSEAPRYLAVGIWSGKVKVNENITVDFLPAAAPALHSMDGSNISLFIATLRNRMVALFPGPLRYPSGATLVKPSSNTLSPKKNPPLQDDQKKKP